MLSGLWLLGIALVAHAAGYVPVVPNLLALAAVVLLWGGHILSPVVVSWANRDLRAHMLKNTRKFILLPLALLLGSVILGVLGDLSQWPGISREVTVHLNPRLFLFYVFLLWNTWHFAAQHFGVLSIYRRSAGQVSNRDRWLDRAFCVTMTCVLTPLAWYSQSRSDLLANLLSYLPSPSMLSGLATAIIATSAILTVSHLTVEAAKSNSSLPRVGYILSIGIQPIFGSISHPIYHMAVFSICHWLIEFALASKILHGQRAARHPATPRLPLLKSGFAIGVLLFVLMSVGMFVLFHSRTFHAIVGIVPASGYGQDSLFSYKIGVFQLAFGALSGAYFGVSFVHFLYDRYLYAFSRPEIRAWIAPHLFSLSPAHLGRASVSGA
jgi:hypothetical protein